MEWFRLCAGFVGPGSVWRRTVIGLLFAPEAMVTFCPGHMLVALPRKSCRLMTKKSAF